jgi:hypothetical protein
VYYASEMFYNNGNESNSTITSMRVINMVMSFWLAFLLYRHHTVKFLITKQL